MISSRKQLVLGLGFALLAALIWIVWNLWGRAVLIAIGLSIIPPALVLLRYPVLGITALAFAITSQLDSFVPQFFNIALFGTFAALSYQKLVRGDYSWRIPPFTLWSLLLFTWIVVSVVWASDYRGLALPVRTFAYSTVIMLLIPEVVRTPANIRMFMYGIGLGIIFTMISSAFGVYTLFTKGLAVQAAGSVQGLQTARYFGHWPGPNVLAHSLMPFIPLFIPFLRRTESIWTRLLFFISILSGVVAVALTLSRAAILSLTLMMGIMIINSRYRWKLISGVLACVFIVVMFLPVDLLSRISSLTTRSKDASMNQRSEIALAAIRIIEDSFPLGAGLGEFYRTQMDYNPHPYKVDHSHNTYLQVLAEQGVIGLVLLIITIISILPDLGSGNGLNRLSLAHHFRLSLFATLAGLLLSMAFESKAGWPAYWIVFALMASYSGIFGSEVTKE